MKKIIKDKILSFILMLGLFFLVNYVTKGAKQNILLYSILAFTIFEIIYWVSYRYEYKKNFIHLRVDGFHIYDKKTFENVFIKKPILHWVISFVMFVISIFVIKKFYLDRITDDLLNDKGILFISLYLIFWLLVKLAPAVIEDETDRSLYFPDEFRFERRVMEIPDEIINKIISKEFSDKEIQQDIFPCCYKNKVVLYVKKGTDENEVKSFALSSFKVEYLDILIEEIRKNIELKNQKEKDISDYMKLIE